MALVNFDKDGSITISARDVDEARLTLKELKLQKKGFDLEKKQVNEQMRQIRASYTNQVRQRGSKFRGGGWLGKIIRAGQTVSHDNARYNLAAALQPYEQRKQWLEKVLLRIEDCIVRVEYYIHENN